jgi:hypothetical protein
MLYDVLQHIVVLDDPGKDARLSGFETNKNI